MVKVFLEIWEAEYSKGGIMRRSEISRLAAAVVIGFCGGLREEEVFLSSLNGMLQFCEKIEKEEGLLAYHGDFKRAVQE